VLGAATSAIGQDYRGSPLGLANLEVSAAPGGTATALLVVNLF
jgi:hypothetical protein